ncbi:cation diffusion facilitator family transporter [Flavobacterium sp. '19STA2R22 D10 B1']|uniref:cation diffusion facilitator family transporter n=1 Tax=Flavobacterium aerium TaxID=3037261 RepID=UPI00278BCE81|nr:cation diffusion facilitator family transporter [Flavobacterium sp. '19STA2R22 D10 B1']
MGHHHGHSHTSNGKALSIAFWLNLSFSIIEVIGGILTNSTAILADAFHDFMDAMAIGSAVLLEKISGKKRSSKFSYGYKRFTLLSALGMAVFLLIGAVGMIIKAVESFMQPHEVNSTGMVWLALLGIAINGFAFLKIRKSNKEGQKEDCDHSHGHSHAHNHGSNHNSRAVMLHLLEDVLGWVAVLIGAIVIHFTNWFWIDPLLAIGIALFISYNATNIMISTMKIFLQSVPEDVNVEDLSKELQNIEGIQSFHDLHIWTMDGNYNIGTLHIVVKDSNIPLMEQINKKVMNLMKQYNIQHPTLQLETTEDHCGLVHC